jgi:hypothetical protein
VSFTVVPLQGLGLPTGSTIPFGTKFVLQDVPGWLKQDESYLKDLSREERRDTLDAKQALVSEYYANSFAIPIQSGPGNSRRGFKTCDSNPQSSRICRFGLFSRPQFASPSLSMPLRISKAERLIRRSSWQVRANHRFGVIPAMDQIRFFPGI